MTEFLRQSGGAAVIDGGLATELERHGADLNDPLWSAKCLLTSPHLIRAVHFSLSVSLSLSVSYFCEFQLLSDEGSMPNWKFVILGLLSANQVPKLAIDSVLWDKNLVFLVIMKKKF